MSDPYLAEAESKLDVLRRELEKRQRRERELAAAGASSVDLAEARGWIARFRDAIVIQSMIVESVRAHRGAATTLH